MRTRLDLECGMSYFTLALALLKVLQHKAGVYLPDDFLLVSIPPVAAAMNPAVPRRLHVGIYLSTPKAFPRA